MLTLFASASSRVPPSKLVGALGVLLVISGCGYWAYRLYTPMPKPAEPAPQVRQDHDVQSASVALWLAPGPEKVDVKVVGAIIAGVRGGAVLSINGGPPRAYAVGESLSQSVVLDRIEVDAVVLEQDGKAVRLPMPAPPMAPDSGIVPVKSEAVAG